MQNNNNGPLSNSNQGSFTAPGQVSPQAPSAHVMTPPSQNPTNNSTIEENVPLGTLGAFLGSLAGVIAIILFGRLGYVAAASGVVMAAGTLFLYKKFAKGLSTKGIVICVIIMVIMTLLAENIAFSLSVMDELARDYEIKTSFWNIFGNLYELISEGIIDGGTYALSLVLVYVFNLLGAFGTVKALSNKNNL